jgi:hypothetical protein
MDSPFGIFLSYADAQRGHYSPLTESRYAGTIGCICPAKEIYLSLLEFWWEINKGLLGSYE